MNKNLFLLWFQGFENAPLPVKYCVDSWKHYNPQWKIHLLDDTNLKQFIEVDISNETIELCHKADIVRGILLQTYGGLWVDATTFCHRPLDDWLPTNQPFFAFEKPAVDRLISNWFLYAEKGSYIMEKWSNATIAYYREHDRAHIFCIHHYLFNDLYRDDPHFRHLWDHCPKFSANGIGPHYLQEHGMFQLLTPATKSDIDERKTPLYKLSHRYSYPSYDENLHVFYLFSTIT
jgi:hypothetical protein